VLDLHDVPMLGVTASLSLENMIQDASEHDRPVFIAGASEQAMRRLDKLGVRRFVSDEHIVANRTQALQGALMLLDGTSHSITESVMPSSMNEESSFSEV
jgi:SulP family sulfate permease